MNPADLPLRDIHLPPPPGWWPPAPGWWLLLACALLAAAALVWFLRRRARTRTRRAALAELRNLARGYEQTRDAHALAAGLSVLLRRLVLAKRPRAQAAGVTGSAWLEMLDALAPRAALDPVARRVLLEAPYRRSAPCDAPALIAACERWLRALPA
jgi:hypothetical protein